MSVMYEFFDHTADVGIRVDAATLEQLFAEAGDALMAFILDAPAIKNPARQITVELAAEDVEDLLHDWLSELLYLFETQHVVLGGFRVKLTDASLTVEAHAEPLDPLRHQPSHEVKAVTYHALRIEQHDDRYVAEIILDI